MKKNEVANLTNSVLSGGINININIDGSNFSETYITEIPSKVVSISISPIDGVDFLYARGNKKITKMYANGKGIGDR